MSKSELPVLQVEAVCCSPLIREPLDEPAAADLARTGRDRFAPASVPGFVVAQVLGAPGGLALVAMLFGHQAAAVPTAAEPEPRKAPAGASQPSARSATRSGPGSAA